MKLADLYSRISPALRPLGLPYSLIMRQRRALYRNGWIAGYAPSRPCVSVGNISWGGTGKTPLTGWLLDWAARNDLKAVVLMRGYRGKPGKRPLLVRRDTPVEHTGDEPLLLARAFPQASVVVFPRRSDAARFAENCLEPDFFILDDGMQHLGMCRDLDIILLRPEDLDEQWGRVIPSGTWREGCSALGAASAFAIKAEPADFEELSSMARKRLAHFRKPLFSFTLAPQGLRPVFPRQGKNNPMLEPEAYAGQRYLLVSGVGKPEQVELTAQQLMGRPPERHFDYADHHLYSEADVKSLLRAADGKLPIICTPKDAVKLKSFDGLWDASVPLWMLETRVEFGPVLNFGADNGKVESFHAWWENWWETQGPEQASTGSL